MESGPTFPSSLPPPPPARPGVTIETRTALRFPPSSPATAGWVLRMPGNGVVYIRDANPHAREKTVTWGCASASLAGAKMSRYGRYGGGE